MSEKREGEKSSGYRRAFGGKNASVQEFKSNVDELKDAVFTINPNQADAAKFEKSIQAKIMERWSQECPQVWVWS